MNAAIGMAKDFIGGHPTIAYLHCPPIIMCALPK
jgi:hypothetical protein